MVSMEELLLSILQLLEKYVETSNMSKQLMLHTYLVVAHSAILILETTHHSPQH